MKRWFGRITPECTRDRLIAEAQELVSKHRVMALLFSEQAARSLLDARHHEESAEHYSDVIYRLSTHEPKDLNHG